MGKAKYIHISIILAIILYIIWPYIATQPKEKYEVSVNGFLSYTNRPPVKYTENYLQEDSNRLLKKIVFESSDANIYSLLGVPKKAGSKAAFIVLPGAGMRKEVALDGLAKDLNDLGFVTITLDQRGIGETQAQVNSIDSDARIFLEGKEPIQHKMIYDVLRAYDFLKGLPDVDAEKIYAAGESMGGRFAIIAAGMESGIKGVLGVSTSGYKNQVTGNPEVDRFLKSIDPDTYVGKISPRPLVMVHSTNDTVIPYALAKDTFSRAGEPKFFWETHQLGHGYDKNGSLEFIQRQLKGWL